MALRQNENTLKILKKELQKEVRKSPTDMDQHRVVDILKQLSEVPMNKELLSTTKIGKVVNKLRKNASSEEISNLSTNIVTKWKTIALKEISSNSNGGSNSSSSSSTSSKIKVEAEVKASSTQKPAEPTKPTIKFPVYQDKAKYVPESVDRDRIQIERSSNSKGPVIYWMSRDQRFFDNWALLHAQEEAKKRDAPLAVVFSLVPKFLQASIRMYGFMLDGLKDVQESCLAHNIPFHLLVGYPQDTLPKFVEKYKISLIVTDMSPLRTGIEWRNQVCDDLVHTDCGFHIVDAHNICPVWTVSDKVEYGARTLRIKINKVLDEYLTGFPLVQPQSAELTISVYGKNWKNLLTTNIDWEQVKSELEVDRSVREVTWCVGGENAARQNLNQFLSKRLKDYEKRNDPTINGLSNMSPWLHFGNIASQRCVLEAKKFSRSNNEAVKSFVEEIVVRKELSDNFCYYNPNGYDKLDGLYPSYDNNSWAQMTLQDHENDRRDYTYTRKQFEAGKTHEKLWNAAQLEMVYFGKMHGFMRMYWAKKILEWSKSPTEALETAIYLNDKYSLDGRDPNGYAGCAWAIAGLHDQGWRERPVFGKIRYMNHAGCKRKFDVEKYVRNVQKLAKRFAKLK